MSNPLAMRARARYGRDNGASPSAQKIEPQSMHNLSDMLEPFRSSAAVLGQLIRAAMGKLGPVFVCVACAGPAEHSDTPDAAPEGVQATSPAVGMPSSGSPADLGMDSLALTEPANSEALLWREQASNAGNYVVRWCTLPEPLPLNEPFEVRVRVRRANGESLPEATCRVAVDAAMPHHGHGMNVQPELIPNADGSHSARGMLFHMGGAWTLYFDITEGGITERAQTIFEL